MFKPIVATLGYVLSPDRSRVLMIHRNKRPQEDIHYGKYNGLGGRLEANEDIVSGMRREIFEESGLTAEQLVLRGTISWPGFGKHGEDWFGFIFRIESWHGTPLVENPEGSLASVEVERVLALPLWEGDRHFVPLVFERTEMRFHGVMPYRVGRRLSWSYS